MEADHEEATRKRDKMSWMDAFRRTSADAHWNPNKDKYEREADWSAGDYRASWHGRWAGPDVSFHDTTSVPPMRFTDDDDPHNSICARDTLQIISIKIAAIRGGLRWPLDVFGMVAARDVLDNCKQIVIYARARRNCQTITEEYPYLALSGPTRAVVTCSDPGTIDVALKVKGATESDDRDLSFLVLTLKNRHYCSYDDEDYTSKLSTLQLMFRHIERAVEATITVRLIGGPPSGFQGVFTASTASIDDVEVLLLAFGEDTLPVADDGTINLSRRVVSVESRRGELKVSIVARCEEDEEVARRDDVVFKPRYAGRSVDVLKVGTCQMQVTVAWSLFSII